jgi:hypothetical protein
MFLHKVSDRHCNNLLLPRAPSTARSTQVSTLLLKHSANMYFAGTDLSEDPVNGPDPGDLDRNPDRDFVSCISYPWRRSHSMSLYGNTRKKLRIT